MATIKQPRRPWRRGGERGQSLAIIALGMTALMGMVGLAVDVSRMYAAKTELTRAVDSAALAGVLELPNMSNAMTVATQYVAQNEPSATASVTQGNGGTTRSLQVTASKPVAMTFLKLFRSAPVVVSATAQSGYNITPVDAVLAIDTSGSMGSSTRGCDASQRNNGCPIEEARQAAAAFTDVLLTGSESASQTVIGVAPWRGCYNPPRNYANCVPTSQVGNLSGNKSTVQGKITGITSTGNTGTNVCLGLHKAREILQGAGSHSGPNVLRYVVLLSDGDNVMNPNSRGSGAPPAECAPVQNSTNLASGCSSTDDAAEREMDQKTYALANSIKALGAEIYVVGLGVCGSPSTAACNPGTIGSSGSDSIRDRNLLKCVASSRTGTNDHYLETDDQTQLTAIFTNIGRAIAFRLTQ